MCGRGVVEVGPVNRIEAANAAASSFNQDVERLVRGSRRVRHLDRLADLAVVIDDFVARPLQLRANEVNDLGEGLWELKAGTLRVPFFGAECPGDTRSCRCGRQLVLPRIVKQPEGRCRTARLTHLFEKRTARTPRREIDKAMAIKREDLE